MYTVGDIVLYTDEAMRDKCPYGQERGWCCGLGEWIVTEVSKKLYGRPGVGTERDEGKGIPGMRAMI